MPHGLTHFQAEAIIDKARGVLELMDKTLDGEAAIDAVHEGLRVVLENQMMIVETLDLIKKEFDKFEDGLNKIL